jgi:sulfite reductase beta subunit-like hemoprotein
MTMVEVCYRLPGKLTLAQMRKLGELSAVYGLRRIRVDEDRQEIQVEFDASRLKESEAVNLLRQAGIPLAEKVQLV